MLCRKLRFLQRFVVWDNIQELVLSDVVLQVQRFHRMCKCICTVNHSYFRRQFSQPVIFRVKCSTAVIFEVELLLCFLGTPIYSGEDEKELNVQCNTRISSDVRWCHSMMSLMQGTVGNDVHAANNAWLYSSDCLIYHMLYTDKHGVHVLTWPNQCVCYLNGATAIAEPILCNV